MKANKLGLWSIVFLGINGIIGSGVFLLPNKAMDLFGPYSLLILLFDMVLVLCISLCFAEASSLFKDTGGPYIYAKEAFGDFIGYEVGFLVWATRIIAFSTMSVGFATALAGIVPEWNTVFMKNVISCGVVVVLSLMNLLGVKPFKIIQNIATIGKLVPLVLFVGIGVFIIDFDNFVAPPDTVYTTTTFGSCAILLFYAFTGFESICVAAGDMDNPTKNVPKATFARLFPAYSAGAYRKFPHIARVVTARQVTITACPGEEDIVTCLDGESFRSREVRLGLSDTRVRFFGPAGCSPTATAR